MGRKFTEAPDISVMVNQPNNGYLVIVMQDDGVTVQSHCKQSDAFQGLLKATANLFVAMANSVSPLPDIENGLTGKSFSEVRAHMDALVQVQREFTARLAKEVSIAATAQQFTRKGMPEGLAQMLVSSIIEERDTDEEDESEEDESE